MAARHRLVVDGRAGTVRCACPDGRALDGSIAAFRAHLPELPEAIALRIHLAARHAADVGGDLAALRDEHAHEHRGPGTIRNHDPWDLAGDLARALRVWRETAELTGDDAD